MKYAGMPRACWEIFHKSFQRNLTEVLKYVKRKAGNYCFSKEKVQRAHRETSGI